MKNGLALCVFVGLRSVSSWAYALCLRELTLLRH